MSIDSDLESELSAVYEEIMWLADRQNITPSVARTWYTHATAERLKRRVRMFTGFVSEQASYLQETLELEHYKRIQTTLTQMVDRHKREGCRDPSEFIETIQACERVHIVTKSENKAAKKAKGDYRAAGISLVEWSSLGHEVRIDLWKRMLRGKVANYKDFKPDA